MNSLTLQIRSVGAGVVTLLLAMAIVAFGVLGWTDARAAVEDTRHNLGSSNTVAGANSFSGTAAVCVFCHTPHGGSTSAAVPLWNRTLADPASYTTYATLNSATLDGAEAPVGSVSIACLSCHDGTQAMDTVLNEPGSGIDNPIYSAGVWTGANQTGGRLNAGIITNLTQDLTNDHPIGIQYGGGGITAAAPTAATNDPDFRAPGTTNLNGTTVWWVDSETTPNTTREKTDMLLYTRSVAGIDSGALQPFVECASCHDPHTTNVTFLRTSNDGSAVCLACHNK